MRLDNIPRNCTPKISNTDGIILGRGWSVKKQLPRCNIFAKHGAFLASDGANSEEQNCEVLVDGKAKSRNILNSYFYWVCCFCRCFGAATCDGSYFAKFGTSYEGQQQSAELTVDRGSW